MSYRHIQLPEQGEKVRFGEDGRPQVSDQPILCYIEGDGIGPDITRACLRIWDAAVETVYGGRRKIHWCELFLGEKAAGLYEGNYYPEETLAAIRELDKAVTKGVIHKNAAARRKSRLMKKLNALGK